MSKTIRQNRQMTTRDLQQWHDKLEEERPMREFEGRRMKKLYLLVGMTQCELAKSAGICTKTLAKFERGLYIQRRKAIKASILNAILFKIQTIFMRSLHTLNPSVFNGLLF